MMTIPAMIVAMIILAIATFKLVNGILQAGEGHASLGVEEKLSQLDALARRHALLKREIKEAELDFEMGKIGVEDHARIERRLKREWLRVDSELRELGVVNQTHRDEIEAELSQRLGGIEDDDGSRRRPNRQLCSACGAPNTLHLKTCSGCGRALSRPLSLDSRVGAPRHA